MRFPLKATGKHVRVEEPSVGRLSESSDETHGSGFKPIWIVLLFLAPCLAVTAYVLSGRLGPGTHDGVLPTAGSAFLPFLIALDLIGLAVLTLLLSRNLIKAYFERRHRLLGSGFRTKLVVAFIGFALVPTLLFAFVASGLINQVVQAWFNERIERVLKDSQEVAWLYHQGYKGLAINSARSISREIARENMLTLDQREGLEAVMTRKRREYNLAGIEVFSTKMETLIHVVDPEVPSTVLSLPSGQLVKDVLRGGEEQTSEQEAQPGRLIRAGVPIPSTNEQDGITGVVIVDQYVPESLLTKMAGISKRYTEYQQINAMKNPIEAGAYLFVTGLTVFILFGATWFGFYVARGITVPIQRLAEGTEAIAKGNLDVSIDVKATDEIGTLVDSFNRMTDDLRVSKAKLEEANISLRQSNLELDRRRAYTEAVVDTIASGVLSIDRTGIITTFNPSGERILGIRGDGLRGRPVSEAFKDLGLDLFVEAYDRILAENRETLPLEGPMEVQGKFLTIGLNVSRMRDEAGKNLGCVLVFEDLTELIKAQKAAAWQEVAQRIAHEIKNPLTPIQLSAQRLRKKFYEESPDFKAIFEDSTAVIINEVTSLKGMVDEFSKFARMPAPQMTRESLHDVIHKVVALYRGGDRDVEFHVALDETMPPCNFDREQINRVLVNLFDNAIEAMQQTGRLWITTEYNRKGQRAIVMIADEGPGIQPEDQDRLFMPYFSKRRSGTGLGLAIVHRIITDHNGSIRAANNQPRGAVFTVELPV